MNFSNLKELKIGNKNVETLAVNGKTVWTKKTPLKLVLTSVNGVPCEYDPLDPEINGNLLYIDGGRVAAPYSRNPEISLHDTVASVVDYSNELTSVENYSFVGCQNLLSVVCPNVQTIGKHAFDTCVQLRHAQFQNVSSIGAEAFFSCMELNEISCMNAKSINDSAFYDCDNLSYVDFPNVETIDGDAFGDCSNISYADLPKAKTIGAFAFEYCENLVSVHIPSIESIGEQAFTYCKNLLTIDCGNVLTAVPTIGAYPFNELPENFVVKVPAALYGQWIAAENWKDVSSHIQPYA